MPAPYTSKAVANLYFKKQRLTQIDLHKLLYEAQGWHLGLKGVPLMIETL